jgi:hypothetical protein
MTYNCIMCQLQTIKNFKILLSCRDKIIVGISAKEK